MPVSSYLLTPPRSLEQAIAELTCDQSDNTSLHQGDIPPDPDQDAEVASSSAS